MKKAILILVALLLTSCSGTQKQPAYLSTQVGTVPTMMTEPQTPTQKSPTNTPVLTQIPTSTLFEFPPWMKNPNTVILAASFNDEIKKSQKIYFYNAVTGEKFEIVTSVDFGGFLWYDSMNFGLLSKDLKTSYKYNLQTGQVLTETTSSQSTRFIANGWIGGLVISNEPKSNEFIFTDTWQTNMSLGKSYIAEWTDDNSVTKVTDTATGQTVWELPLSKNRYGTELLWSPINESHLAFLQGSPEPLNGFIAKDMTLTIVDVVNRKILSSYDGDFGILRWSPDGKMILYLNPSFRYRNYGISFTDAPCLLFLTTDEKGV